MNLKEKMDAKLAEIAELKSAVEEGDEEAAENLAQAVEDAQEIQDAIEEAEKADEMLKTLATPQAKTVDAEAPAKSLGEYAEKNLNLEAVRNGDAKSAATTYGFKAATDPHTSQTMVVVDNSVVDVVPRTLELRRLFGSETISGNSLQYFVLGATEGNPDEVAENGEKPQFHVPAEAATATLTKIAGWYYETDELLEDNAFLATSIDNRGLFELDLAIEEYLMNTLVATSGIQTLAPAGSALSADDIFTAIMNVKSATNYSADAIVINPADYQTLRLAKDGNDQYYGGGYFYGPYGNTEMAQQPGLWGLATIVTTAVPQGTVLVGAFRAAASVITKAGAGARVEVVRGDHDDRIHNRVTVVVEERLALAVRIPAAFVKIA